MKRSCSPEVTVLLPEDQKKSKPIGRTSGLREKVLSRSVFRWRCTRQDDKLEIPKVALGAVKKGFSHFGPRLYNAFPDNIKTARLPLKKHVKECLSGEEEKGDNPAVADMDDDSDLKQDLVDTERWQLGFKSVRDRMLKLLNNSYLSDCTFIVGNEENSKDFKLHKVVMAMSSPVFEDLLMGSGDCDKVVIKDVDSDTFRQLTEYIYLDMVSLLTFQNTLRVFLAAQKYDLRHLSEKAVEFMISRVSIDNIWSLFDAVVATDDKILKKECQQFVKKNAGLVLKHPKFGSVDRCVVCLLVDQERFDINETELVGGVIQWAIQQCVDTGVAPTHESMRNMIGPDIFAKLRFLAVNEKAFVSEIAYSTNRTEESLLTLEESYAVLMNIVVPGSYQLPEGFNSAGKPQSQQLLRLTRKQFNPLGNYRSSPCAYGGMERSERIVVLSCPTTAASLGSKSFAMEMSVSKPIKLHGLQVPTFISPMVSAPNKIPKDYDESYVVTVLDGNNTLISTTKCKGRVEYNHVTDIIFNDCVFMEKNIKYTVMVYTSNTYYLNKKLCTVEEYSSVKFSFKDVVAYFGKPVNVKLDTDFGFVTQLLFTVLN